MNSDKRRNQRQPTDKKDEQLEKFRRQNTGPGKKMTDDNAVKVSNDERILKAGRRGPALLQDFHYYKKITSFTRERIPEKVVHARGFGVYGDFEAYRSLRHMTS